MEKTITLDEMRDRAGKLIFGDDWIGDLTDQQYELLRAYPLVNREIRRTNGTTHSLPHVEPVPIRLAAALDRARGRQIRMDAQITTADTWLQDHGVFDHPAICHISVADVRTLAIQQGRKWLGGQIRAETKAQKRTAAPERRRGPKAQILPRVIADMRRQIAEGKLTLATLADLPDKELQAQFSASRDRVRAARAHVLNGHA